MPTPPGVTNSQRLVAVCAAVLVTILFINGVGLVGLAGSLLYLFIAVPVAYVYMRFGTLCGVSAFVVVTFTLSVQYGFSAALFEYVAMFGFPSVALGYLFSRGWRWDQAVVITVIATVLLTVGLVTAVAVGDGTAVSSVADQYVEKQLDLIREFFTSGEECA